MFRRFQLIFAVLLSTASCVHAQDFLYAHYTPPDVVPEADNHLAAIAAELNDPADANSITDAANRFETYLRESGNGMIGTGDGSEVWIENWIQKLDDAQRKSLAIAMESLVGPAAQQALDDVRNNPAADPVDACAIAYRYPLTAAAADALHFAAERSRGLGDVENADAFEALAEHKTPRTPIVAGQRLPFTAPWFGTSHRSAWMAMRIWPVAAGGNIYAAGPTQVVAMSGNGSALWRGPIGADQPPSSGAANPTGFTRGPAFIPALFCLDSSQPPAIVVVRQPPIQSQSQPQSHATNWAIRALRGSDGQLLWSTESSNDLSRLSFASTPVIAGRYVYAFAGELGDDLDRLSLVALELTTGRQLWRCDLGSISHPVPAKHGRQVDPAVEPYRPWMNQTSPALTADSVVLAPDVGAVIAVDRFDGALRWLHPYTPIGLPVPDQRRSALEAALAAQVADQNHRAGDPIGLPIRWNNTPAIADQTVVVAPQDSASVMGYSLADGRPLWEVAEVAALNPGKLDSAVESLSSFSLIGVRNKLAILQSGSAIGSLLSLALDDGHVAERSDAVVYYGGPALIRDDRVLVPGKDHGVFGYAALINPVASQAALFNDLIRIDAVQKALQSCGAISAFTLPK